MARRGVGAPSLCEGLYFLVEVKGLLTLEKEIYFFNYD